MNESHPKILLVEDEPDVCSAIQSFLGRRGYIVSVTASGKDALSLIEITKPDAVLLDFTLPDMNGKETLSVLRSHDTTTKVIVITGELLSDKEMDKIEALGISAYFQKPVTLEELERTVNDVLGNAPRKAVIVKSKDAGSAKANPAQRAVVHELKNLLGIIRNKCENFTLNIQDGIYKDKSEKELNVMAVETMNEVIKTVDRATDAIEKIPRVCEVQTAGDSNKEMTAEIRNKLSSPLTALEKLAKKEKVPGNSLKTALKQLSKAIELLNDMK